MNLSKIKIGEVYKVHGPAGAGLIEVIADVRAFGLETSFETGIGKIELDIYWLCKDKETLRPFFLDESHKNMFGNIIEGPITQEKEKLT